MDTLLHNPEISAKLSQALEIAKRYYPKSSLSWNVWAPTGAFDGFWIGMLKIEQEIPSSFNVWFEQDFTHDAFPLNPYTLTRVEFCANTYDERNLDIGYAAAGENYSGWFGIDEAPNPQKVASMCNEVFLALKDLAISAEFNLLC